MLVGEVLTQTSRRATARVGVQVLTATRQVPRLVRAFAHVRVWLCRLASHVRDWRRSGASRRSEVDSFDESPPCLGLRCPLKHPLKSPTARALFERALYDEILHQKKTPSHIYLESLGRPEETRRSSFVVTCEDR